MTINKIRSAVLLPPIARVAIPAIALTFLSSCVSEEEIRSAERKADLLETKIKDLEDDQALEIERLVKELESLGAEKAEAQTRTRQAESELDGVMEEIKSIREEFDDYKRKYRISFRSKAVGTKIDTIALNDGTILKRVEITEINPAGFKIKHSNGINKLAYTKLPLELQEQYMFSAEEALGFVNGTIDSEGNAIDVAATDANAFNDPDGSRSSLEIHDPFAEEDKTAFIAAAEQEKKSALAGRSQQEMKVRKQELRNEIATLQMKAAVMTEKIKRYNAVAGRGDGEAWSAKAKALTGPLKKVFADIKVAEGKIRYSQRQPAKLAVPTTTRSSEETEAFASSVAASLKEGDVIALTGDLGAGKTHFTRGLASGLGIPPEIAISSPTFSIVQEYQRRQAPTLPLRFLPARILPRSARSRMGRISGFRSDNRGRMGG